LLFVHLLREGLLEVEARLRRIGQPLPSHPSLPTQQMMTRLPRSVEAMIGFITEHYREPLQLGQIAQAVGLHPGYATDLFRTTLGITIMDYLAQQRVAHTQRLLATTDQNGTLGSYGSRLHVSQPFLCHVSENHWPVSPCLLFVSPALVQATARALHS
jgi:AraC-like DNA-binding protein